MPILLGDLINEYIRKLNPLAKVFIAVFQAVSRAAIVADSSIIYIPWGPFGRTITIVESPYKADEKGNEGPLGLRYYVATAAPDQETAMRYMIYAANRLHTMMQLSANASAFPLHLRLMTVHHSGTVPFRELLWEPEVSHHLNTRLVDNNATTALFSAGWNTAEERLGRAAVQYEIALRRLHSFENPIALGHLYMGVETITKAVIRKRCEQVNCTETDLAVSLGIDAADEKLGHKLDVEVRRQLIFRNDAQTYRDIRMVSDGLEHGFASWKTIWSVPEDTFPKSAGHLRHAILGVSDLDDAHRATLLGSKFANPVEAGPTLAFEATAPIASIDLRAVDFKIAKVRRVMISSSFDEDKGEYHYDYQLESTPQGTEA